MVEECSSFHSQRSPCLVPLGKGDVFLNMSKVAWSENLVQAQAGSCTPQVPLSGVYLLVMKLGHFTHAAGFRPKISRLRNFLSPLLPGAPSLTLGLRGAAFQRLQSLLPAPPGLTSLWLWPLGLSSSYQGPNLGPSQTSASLFSTPVCGPGSVL